MTLDQIKYFLVMAQWLNFSRAAERLYMTQPNLTKQIAALERELGFALFKRNKRQVTLTEAGIVFRQRVEDAYYQMNQAIEQTRYTYGSAEDRILMGVVEDEQLPEWIYDGLRRYQRGRDVRLLLERNTIQNLRIKLLAGSYDLAVTTENDVVGVDGIRYQRLMRTQVTLAVRSDHPNAGKPGAGIQDFKDETFIMATPREERRYSQAMERLFSYHGIAPNVQFVDSTESAVLNVEAGVGVAVLPSHVTVRPDHRIVFLPIFDLEEGYLVVAWRTDEGRSHVLELIDLILNRFVRAELPGAGGPAS